MLKVSSQGVSSQGVSSQGVSGQRSNPSLSAKVCFLTSVIYSFILFLFNINVQLLCSIITRVLLPAFVGILSNITIYINISNLCKKEQFEQ